MTLSKLDPRATIYIVSFIFSLGAAWALLGSKVFANEDRSKKSEINISQMQDRYVTKEILELKLRPIQASVERIENTNWLILQQLKAQNGVHTQ